MVRGDYIDAVGTIVKDIIELKWESDNIPEIENEDELADMFKWYLWAFQHGLVEVVYKYGVLLGFLDWIRLFEVPETRAEEDFVFSESYKEGPVLYIANCCIRDDRVRHGTMWRLWHMAKNKNNDCEDYVSK